MKGILRTRLVTALVLVLVFGAGVVSGLAFDRGVEANDRRPDRGSDVHRTPIYMKVNPTARQQAQIDSILREHRAAWKALHDEFRKAVDQFHKTYDPRYEALVKKTRAGIDSVLTTEQAAKYDSLLAAYDRRRSERGSSRQSRK